ncbi:hypothetical protein EJ110_NYTH58748 [Nymphaea thermarum]|nr:hypothetical protein EJ110_NYTH58748 [Nymphaea thermarum]
MVSELQPSPSQRVVTDRRQLPPPARRRPLSALLPAVARRCPSATRRLQLCRPSPLYPSPPAVPPVASLPLLHLAPPVASPPLLHLALPIVASSVVSAATSAPRCLSPSLACLPQCPLLPSAACLTTLRLSRRRLWPRPLPLITAVASGISLFVVVRRRVSDQRYQLSLCRNSMFEANTSSFVSSGEMKSSPFSSLITKMNGGNYEMWAMQVKLTLIAHDKEHLILEPEPVQKVGKYTTWFKDNSLVMVWFVGTLSQDIANEVLHKESAKDIDMLMVGVFLSGLDSVYESAKNQMLTSPSIPPIDEAYSRLSRIPIPASTVPDTTSAMLATRGRGGSFFARGRGGRGRGNTASRPVCQFCHRIGHTVDKCWQKHGRPTFANQTASPDYPEQPKAQHTTSSSELRVDDIISQLRNLIGDRSQHAPDPTTSTITTAASASSSGMYSAYTVCLATDTTD